MVARTRKLDSTFYESGSVVRHTSPYTFQQTVKRTVIDSCSDSMPGPGALIVDHQKSFSGHMSGAFYDESYDPPRLVLDGSGYPVLYNVVPSHLAISTMSALEGSNALLARTNPSRPSISLPNFLFELKDLPELIKVRGDNLISLVGSSYLNYNFGWRQTIADLRNLWSTLLGIEKRKLEFQRLMSKGGLRRRMMLDSQTKTSSTSVTINSWGTYARGLLTTTTEMKLWGTVRWIPQASTLPTGSVDDEFVKRVTLGLTLGQAGVEVWNAIPFTWITDYFFNVSDWLQAHNNSLATPSGEHWIMKSLRTRQSYANSAATPGFSVSVDPGYRTTLYRWTGSAASYEAHLPFLTVGQLSNLAALSAKYN